MRPALRLFTIPSVTGSSEFEGVDFVGVVAAEGQSMEGHAEGPADRADVVDIQFAGAGLRGGDHRPGPALDQVAQFALIQTEANSFGSHVVREYGSQLWHGPNRRWFRP